MSVLKCIPHIFEGGMCNFKHRSSYSSSKFQQCGGQWWNVSDILYVAPDEETQGGHSQVLINVL
jgi:hypothetical protein